RAYASIPDERKGERGGGKRGEEAGRRRQPGDVVAEADLGGLLRQPPDDVAHAGPARGDRFAIGTGLLEAFGPRGHLSTVGHMSVPPPSTTHEVTNQVPPLVGHDVFA